VSGALSTLVLSGLMQLPDPSKLVGTTLDRAALRASWTASRGVARVLCLYAITLFIIVLLADHALVGTRVT
jgi:hypothetical protein